MKVCSTCRAEKELSEFYKLTRAKDGYYWECKECRKVREKAHRASNPERQRAISRKSKYGLLPEQYAALLEAQGSRCAICHELFGEGKTRCPQVDHSHAFGEVRALLCTGCNTAIGSMKESPSRLRAAARYLERFVHVR